MMAKNLIDEEVLDQVVGGLLHFNYKTNVLSYRNEETKKVTQYTILDFDKAWEMSNAMHAQNYHEDTIIAKMKASGYIR